MPVPKVLVGKVIVVGPASVGKTCLVRRFVDDVFDANTQSTLGCDSKEKTLNVTAEPIKLILYDTAGQERFAQLAGNYYRQADICLLCFDLSNSTSFDQIKWWQNQVAQHNERAEFVLVGTKQDLAPKLDVSFARRYANENVAVGVADLIALDLLLEIDTIERHGSSANHHEAENERFEELHMEFVGRY
ncbi:Rab5, putative [Perkinsus marinus ATCC 50983]|uniref:Rab5, putative n=1 Tax=Perkinsus marinus (strain ATCC 50983 / TXsc) TaxID=423536 RepID=C5KTM0_PERM5|nr:Rab5, putative [Perkinsus marinus ATCC 50983]EER12199.1 Rab5, putative [Perkinsus marinus ATCC 50983]|eukprot:XP_002780404.1 Rab5, putative [Perkinsus marinus ATCC 50983]